MILGVIGGLGPMATACFMKLVIGMTKAKRDQDHLEMIVYNCPQIPDRTDYILGRSDESPLPRIIELGQRLNKQGASYIAIPCITAHYFHREIEVGSGVRVIRGISETVSLLKDTGVSKVGLMATDGTVQSRIFQKEVEAQGMELVLPSETNQRLVMSLIYDDVKQGKQPDMEKFRQVKKHLIHEGGAQVVVLGCTELSVIKQDYDLGEGICDCMEVLARTSVLLCGKELNPQYETLFTPVK